MVKNFRRRFAADTTHLYDDNMDYNKTLIKSTIQHIKEMKNHYGFVTMYDVDRKLGFKKDGPELALECMRYGWNSEDVIDYDISVLTFSTGPAMYIDFHNVQVLADRKYTYFLDDLKEATEEINDYWKDQMPMNAMEEMSELTKEISKYERNGFSISKQGLVDEMGDAMISMLALTNRYDIEPYDIFNRIKSKLAKKY